MYIRDFQICDIEELQDCFEPHCDSEIKLRSAEWRLTNSLAAKTGYLEDGTIIAAAGIVMQFGRVGAAWMMMRTCASKHLLSVYRGTVEWMKIVWEHYDLVRLHTYVRADFPAGARFVEKIGFKKEGLMRKFCPDETDAWLYAKIRD